LTFLTDCVNGSRADPSLGNEGMGSMQTATVYTFGKYLVLKVYGVMRPETTHKSGPLLAARDSFSSNKALTSASGSETKHGASW